MIQRKEEQKESCCVDVLIHKENGEKKNTNWEQNDVKEGILNYCFNCQLVFFTEKSNKDLKRIGILRSLPQRERE